MIKFVYMSMAVLMLSGSQVKANSSDDDREYEFDGDFLDHEHDLMEMYENRQKDRTTGEY